MQDPAVRRSRVRRATLDDFIACHMVTATYVGLANAMALWRTPKGLHTLQEPAARTIERPFESKLI